jgi:uncharacterized OB-fold protein
VTGLQTIATQLPVWGDDRQRSLGADEDAITLAVGAGYAALDRDGADSAAATVEHVLLVTRDLPQLEGNSTAPLLAGLGLPDTVRASLVLGGAPQALDAVTHAAAGTLVIGVDATGAPGAAAALVGDGGLALRPLARSDRSLPLHVRDAQGRVSEYNDARLTRERGLIAGLARLGLDAKPIAIAGVRGKDAAAVTVGGAPTLPTDGASAPLFALAALAEQGSSGPLVAFEEATLVAVEVGTGAVTVRRDEPAPRPAPQQRLSSEGTIAISLPAYERAFEAKLRLEAGKCTQCGELALPPRTRCLRCGSEEGHTLVPLPRRGTVYTAVTVRVPVPGVLTPYSLVIVDLGDTEVRLIAKVTGAEPASVAIDDTGDLVLRRVAVRNGVTDYGYAFRPDRAPTPASDTKTPVNTALSGGQA